MKIHWPRRKPNIDETPPARQSFVGAEAPIRAAAEDLLRRGPYVDRITDVLTTAHVPEGRVFAIRSAWGNGKSSLKNLIIEKLKGRSGHALWLDFNPWQWGDGDAIASALFAQMASVLGSDYSPEAQKRAKSLREYGAALTSAGSALKGAADDKTGLSAFLPGLVLAAAGIGLRFPGIPAPVLVSWALIAAGLLQIAGAAFKRFGPDRSGEPLSAIREDLERLLRKLPGPLIVFVDDLDRLDKEQIRLMIRQVKVNANLPNIVFVLLFQPSIVTAALEEIADGAGADYLAKIVQANFDLPAVPQEKIFGLFVNYLQPVLGDFALPANGFSEVRWGNMLVGGVRRYIGNLRDARRLLASIDIHLPLHQGPRAFEANVIDFVALEALRVFDPELHTTIANNKALFLQTGRLDSVGAHKVDKAAIDAILAKIPESRRESVTELLRDLFPTVSWALGGSSYGGEWVRGWIAEKRVCTAQMFARYFEQQIPEGAVSDSQLALFFESAKSHEGVAAQISDLQSAGLLAALVGRLDESVDQIPVAAIGTILPALFEIGATLKAASDQPFNGPYISTWRSALWYLRAVPDPKDRSRVMAEALLRTEALDVPALIISLDLEERDKQEADKPNIFDDDGLTTLKQIWVDKVRKLALDGNQLFNQGDLVSLLYRWRDFEDSFDGPRGWVNTVAAEPGGLPKLVERFVNIGRSHTIGDYVETRTENFERAPVEDFFDLKALQTRLAGLDATSLTEDRRRLVSALKIKVDAWLLAPGQPETESGPGEASDDLSGADERIDRP